MTWFIRLLLTLIFVAPGCSAKDDIIKALKRHETAFCACKTEASCDKAANQFDTDPILMEVGIESEFLQFEGLLDPLKERIGDKNYTAFRAFRKKVLTCLGTGSDTKRPK